MTATPPAMALGKASGKKRRARGGDAPRPEVYQFALLVGQLEHDSNLDSVRRSHPRFQAHVRRLG